MSFELKKGERIPKGVRRIVCKRIDKALETISEARAVSDHAVHETRKRFKEIRGTLRLVRDELGEKNFRRENTTFRDAGRPLSALRDAKVLVDTLDQLIAHFDGRVKPASVSSLKRVLIDRRRKMRKQVLGRDHTVSGIVRRIRAAKKRVEDWPLKKRGWKAIKGGLRTVYRQGRRAMQKALSDTCDETLHEWRKRTKDLRYEVELLQALWPEMIEPLAGQAHRLTDLLGEDHDLAVLREIAQEEGDNGTEIDRELLFALIDERRASLQKEAFELGGKLYEERALEFVARLHGYWQTSRKAA
jgi:CHAD domain-containing protein